MNYTVQSFPRVEQETTITYMADDKMVSVYTSVKRDITKVMKLADEENIEILTVDKNGNPTSVKALLHMKNINIRPIPSTCKID